MALLQMELQKAQQGFLEKALRGGGVFIFASLKRNQEKTWTLDIGFHPFLVK